VALAVTLMWTALGGTAQAYRTEVHQREQQQRHLALVRWDRHVARLERLEAKRAAEEAAREAAEAAAEPATTAAPAPIPSYSGGVLSSTQVANYARGAGFPENLISTMVAIAWRESRFNPGAVNSTSGACGLWQMYPCPGNHALDPATNAAMAYAKYDAAGGLSPWGY